MASCGFHWLAVDLEHSTISLEQAETCFIAAERHGVAPLARLSSADPFMGRRLLDAGALGLLVPVVEDAAAFAAFAQHCFYTGKRGAGLSRCNGYGDDFDAYYQGFRPLLIPQVETRKGVEAALSLAAMPEVDALFLGPYDLSADLGTPGDFTTPAFRQMAEKVRQACAAHGKALGIHQVKPVAKELKARVAEGYRFIAYSTDIIAMRAALGSPLESLE
ncbi:MAG: hypothetical protein A2516_08815 [Alphaproteobacteria bacterium RIFOXYD12_FULL_60_8]|nr:MAG: hypothetical protein A2516_08815 [Alphaproteobacteria bacterium RIFOXYD12_FULL_60_8]